MKNFARLNFHVGLITLIHFAVTGLLMKMHFFGTMADDIAVRMMLRANHLYILFSGLLNLLLWFSIGAHERGWIVKLLFAAVALAAIGLNIAFYTDPSSHSIQRDLTRLSLYGCFGGTVLYLLYLQFVRKPDI